MERAHYPRFKPVLRCFEHHRGQQRLEDAYEETERDDFDQYNGREYDTRGTGQRLAGVGPL